MVRPILMLAALFGSTAAAAQTPRTLLLTAVLHDGDRVVGEPRLTIASGKPARIVISQHPNERYELTITALPSPDGTIVTRWAIHAQSAGGDRSATPTMTVLPGTASSIAFGEESALAQPFQVDFKLIETN